MKHITTILKGLAAGGLLIWPTMATSQVEIFGYFETEGDLLQLRGETFYLGYNKLRVDLETSPVDGLEISTNLISQFYHGRLNIDPRLYLPERLLDDYDVLMAMTPNSAVVETLFPDETFLDNAQLRLSKNWWDLTFGRQQLSTGVGYTWNPTDIFNVKNIIDPTYEQRGVDAVRLDAALPLGLGLSAIVQPGESVGGSSQYYQLKGSIRVADVSTVYAHTMPDNDYYRDLVGLNIESELAGIGLRTEIAANRFNFDNDALEMEYVIGADYTTESSLYLLGEYLHNDLGLEPETGSIMDYFGYYSGLQHSLNQNYLFLLGQYPATDVMIIGAFAIANLDDQSMIFAPEIQYSLMESVDLSAYIIASIGDRNTEFGIQDLSARVRLRAYF